ncbi:MAG TPA: biopolymer transporter ExbD [Candidatus Sulfopaludibacter sp.]|jgi:biopolymer transport protein ExbD|nr:biopolymer transporter ExbD [Candidatus Sulfopaludibacter sp.]
MAMSLGGKGQRAEINMTPMIDVLLVLIIIFMVITPPVSTGLPALVPQASPPDITAVAPERPHEIVISVTAAGVELNQEALTLEGLHARLLALFAKGGNQVIFLRGDKDLEFRRIAEVIDIAKGAGVNRMAFMTR